MNRSFADTFGSGFRAGSTAAKSTKADETATRPEYENNPPESKIPVVTAKQQPRRHKVVQFGYTVTIEGEVPDSYRFQYPANPDNPEELFPGVIPAGYSSVIEVEDVTIYMHTRQGALSPDYQICIASPDNPLGDWSDSVDALWMETLGVLEEYQQVSEEGLDFLDADPLFLFGLADPATQKALEKASSVPMLRCMGQRPVLGEWFAYLNADPHCEQKFLWVVESFAEVELPSPWTSYKGVGSIVCYLNNETNETTWKHPFYDYFAQLLDHCRKASTEEHIKLRINRMLWTYEADCAADLATQQPLLSPKYIRNMGDILECDLRTEPFLVNTMKTFLKAFSQQYRLEEDIEIQEIKWCREIAENERQKAAISHDLALEDCDPSNDESKKIDPAVHAQIYCVDCGVLAVMFCTTCQDSLCEDCFGRLHSKGNRRNHEFNNIIPCSFCQVYPAKLQCTYTFGNFCHECYARKHVKTLPKFLDLKPLKIDYRMKSSGSVPIVQKSQGKYYDPHRDNPSSIVFRESTLDENWHSFYDLRGAMYYYNFQTNESMRRETERVIESDPMENRTLLNLSQDHRPRSLKFYSSPIKVVEKNETPRKHHHHGHHHGHDKTPGKDGGHAGHAAGTPSTAAPDSPVMQESP